jgi:prepilin-type N-terminal cleavage/methylation domain-containing protein
VIDRKGSLSVAKRASGAFAFNGQPPGTRTPWIKSMLPNRSTRGGMTLMELLAVVTLLGIFTAVAASRMDPSSLMNFSAEADARRLALDLLQARRRAVSTGDNHYLAFTQSGGTISGYNIYRANSSGPDTAVELESSFAANLNVTSTHTSPEFTFDGSALANYQITVAGPNRTWTIDVIPLTGLVRMAEDSP